MSGSMSHSLLLDGSSNHNAQVSQQQSQEFFQLVKDGKINDINALLQANPRLSKITDSKKNTGLYYAAVGGDRQISDLLLEFGAEVNAACEAGNTALMAAAEKGFSQCCELYIKQGADVNATNNGGNTALHHAASRGNRDVCRVLIEQGAKIVATNAKNLTPIDEARAMQHFNVCDYLTQQSSHRMHQQTLSAMSGSPSQISPASSVRSSRSEASFDSRSSEFPQAFNMSRGNSSGESRHGRNWNSGSFYGFDFGTEFKMKRPSSPHSPESSISGAEIKPDLGNPYLWESPTDNSLSDHDKAPGHPLFAQHPKIHSGSSPSGSHSSGYSSSSGGRHSSSQFRSQTSRHAALDNLSRLPSHTPAMDFNPIADLSYLDASYAAAIASLRQSSNAGVLQSAMSQQGLCRHTETLQTIQTQQIIIGLMEEQLRSKDHEMRVLQQQLFKVATEMQHLKYENAKYKHLSYGGLN